MKIKSFILAAGMASLLPLAHAAERVNLLPAANDDLVATTLSRSFTSTNWPSRHVEQSELRYQHSVLERDKNKHGGYAFSAIENSNADAALISESRQYYIDTTGGQLADGIDLPLTAPGAVIRLSTGTSDNRSGLSLRQLELKLNGNTVDARKIAQNVTGGRQLRASGWRVPENTLAFRMDRATGAGTLTLRYSGLTADAPVLVHVFEPESRWVARLALNNQRFLAGQTITASLMIDDGLRQQTPTAASAILSAPGGEHLRSMHRSGGDGFWQLIAPEQVQSNHQGLYEIHLHVEQRFGDLIVRRDISHAVSIAPSLARFSGTATVAHDRQVQLALPVEASLAGRYQINATLYATDQKGELQPAIFSQSAAVLPAGGGPLSIAFDTQALAQAGLGAPFELRDVSLLDQGRMLQLEHRQRALVIE